MVLPALIFSLLSVGSKEPDTTRGILPLAAAAITVPVPGAGLWFTGHPVRAGLSGTLAIWLYGDAAQRTWQGIPKLRRERRVVQNHWLALSDTLSKRTDTAAAKTQVLGLRDSLMTARGREQTSRDYRNSELAWAVGVHALSIVDAAETAWLNRGGKRPEGNLATAAWLSAILPGAGQIYNGHYAKAALLYLGIGGSVTSGLSRQWMVDYWRDQGVLARADGRSDARPKEQADFFRKRRNQYLWGLGLVYVYQILDAAVDARLSHVPDDFPLTLTPSLEGPGLQVALEF